MMEFLNTRPQMNGRPIRELIEQPELIDGWYRCLWINRLDQLPTGTVGEHGEEPIWEKAFHATKIEALWAIFCQGHLKASEDEKNGERFVYGKGVYSHSEWTKATHYARWTRFHGNLAWVRVLIQIDTDRTDRVVPKSSSGKRKPTDQWITKSLQRTHLTAVWFQIKTDSEMELQDEVSVGLFDPVLEAQPYWIQGQAGPGKILYQAPHML